MNEDPKLTGDEAHENQQSGPPLGLFGRLVQEQAPIGLASRAEQQRIRMLLADVPYQSVIKDLEALSMEVWQKTSSDALFNPRIWLEITEQCLALAGRQCQWLAPHPRISLSVAVAEGNVDELLKFLQSPQVEAPDTVLLRSAVTALQQLRPRLAQEFGSERARSLERILLLSPPVKRTFHLILENDWLLAPTVMAKLKALQSESTHPLSHHFKQLLSFISVLIRVLEGETDLPDFQAVYGLESGNQALQQWRSGDSEALKEAMTHYERGLEGWSEQSNPEIQVTLVLAYVEALALAKRPLEQQQHWIDRALRQLPPSFPPTERAQLHFRWLELRLQQSALREDRAAWIADMHLHLEQIRACAEDLPTEMRGQLLWLELFVNEAEGQCDEAIARVTDELPKLDLSLHPDVEVKLRAQSAILLLTRDQGRDFRRAEEHIRMALSRVPQTRQLTRLTTAVSMLLTVAFSEKQPRKLAPLELSNLLVHLPTTKREELEVATEAYNSRFLGTPDPKLVAERMLLLALNANPEYRVNRLVHTFSFARTSLKTEDEVFRRIRQHLEPALLGHHERLTASSIPALLLELAQHRLVPLPPSLLNVEQALRLIERARRLAEDMSRVPGNNMTGILSTANEFHNRIEKLRTYMMRGAPQDEAFQPINQLEELAQHLDPNNAAGVLELAYKRAYAERQAHERKPDAGHRARGLEIALKALENPHLHEFPAIHAQLLRVTAELEAYQTFLPESEDPEVMQSALKRLEQAADLDLASAPAVKIEVLTAMGNLRSDLCRVSDPEYLELLTMIEEQMGPSEKSAAHTYAQRVALALEQPMPASTHQALQAFRQRSQLSFEQSMDAFIQASPVIEDLQETAYLEIVRFQRAMASTLVKLNSTHARKDAKVLAQVSLDGARARLLPLDVAEACCLLARIELDSHKHDQSGDLKHAWALFCEARLILSDGASFRLTLLMLRLGLDLQNAMETAGISVPGERVDIHTFARMFQQAAEPSVRRMQPGVSHASADLIVNFLERELSGTSSLNLLRGENEPNFVKIKQMREDFEAISKGVNIAESLKSIRLVWENGQFEAAARNMEALVSAALIELPFIQNRIEIIQDLPRMLDKERVNQYPWEFAARFLHVSATFVSTVMLGYPPSNDTEAWFERCELWSRQAISLVESHSPHHQLLGALHNTLGFALLKRRAPGRPARLKEARRSLEQSLELAQASHDIQARILTLANLAELMGELSLQDPQANRKAVQCWTELVALHRQRNSRSVLMGALVSLAEERMRADPPDLYALAPQAVRELEEALALSAQEKTGEELRPGILILLGQALKAPLKTGDTVHPNWKRAEACLMEAIGLCRAKGNTRGMARAYHHLGILYLRSQTGEHWHSAIKCFGHALQSNGLVPLEQFETLEPLLKAMVAVPPQHWPRGILWPFAGDCRRCIEQLVDLGYHLQALQLEVTLMSFLIRPEILERERGTPYTRQDMIRLCTRAESFWTAATVLEEQLDLANLAGSLWTASACLSARAGAKPLEILEQSSRGKARTLLLHRGSRTLRHGPAVENELLDLDLQHSQARLDGGVPGIFHQLKKREAVADVLTGRSLPDPASSTPDNAQISSERLEAFLRLHPATAFLDIACSTPGTVAVIATLDDAQKLSLELCSLTLNNFDVLNLLRQIGDSAHPGWLDSLENLQKAPLDSAQEHRDAAIGRWLEAAEQTAAVMERCLLELHRRLLGPLTAGLAAKGIRHLIFAVQGLTCHFPLGAAAYLRPDESPNEEGSRRQRLRFLFEDFESIRLVPSAACLRPDSKGAEGLNPKRPGHSQPIRFTLLGADDKRTLPRPEIHTGELLRLWQGAGAQVEVLGSALGHQRRATKEAALQAFDRSDVIHVLCHGQFDGWELEQTGFALEDGLLSAQRLLERPGALKAKLVVACACQSGRTRDNDLGGEWRGSTGMLLRSGVDTVVGALWDVSYLASARLMERLHAALVAGQTAPVALALAMREALAEGRLLAHDPEARESTQHPMVAHLRGKHRLRMARLLASPLFWAGFEVIGVG